MVAACVPYYRQQVLPHSNLLDPHLRSQFAGFFVFVRTKAQCCFPRNSLSPTELLSPLAAASDRFCFTRYCRPSFRPPLLTSAYIVVKPSRRSAHALCPICPVGSLHSHCAAPPFSRRKTPSSRVFAFPSKPRRPHGYFRTSLLEKQPTTLLPLRVSLPQRFTGSATSLFTVRQRLHPVGLPLSSRFPSGNLLSGLVDPIFPPPDFLERSPID